MSKHKKLIVVIEIDMERNVTDIGDEICRRITMHPHVQDANLVSISESLAHTWAPKPQLIKNEDSVSENPARSFIGSEPK